jgi:hypothetical protein
MAAAMANPNDVGAAGLTVLQAPLATAPGQSWRDADTLSYVSGTFGRYRVRLAQGARDRFAACRLRFNVFNLELGRVCRLPTPLALTATALIRFAII